MESVGIGLSASRTSAGDIGGELKKINAAMAELPSADHTHDASSITSGVFDNDRIRKGTPTVAGIIQLSNKYNGVSDTKGVTEKALSVGLGTKADNGHSHDASELPDASLTNRGTVQLSNKYDGVSETKAVTEKALSNALSNLPKAGATTSIVVTGNKTIVRLDQITFVQVTGSNDKAIIIDASTFDKDDTIVINNWADTAGTITLSNADGGIITPWGNGASHSITGRCKVELMKFDTSDNLTVV